MDLNITFLGFKWDPIVAAEIDKMRQDFVANFNKTYPGFDNALKQLRKKIEPVSASTFHFYKSADTWVQSGASAIISTSVTAPTPIPVKIIGSAVAGVAVVNSAEPLWKAKASVLNKFASFSSASTINTDQDRLQYLHKLKSARQKQWLKELQEWVKQKINDVLGSSPDADRLFIIALPEFFFIDVLDNDSHFPPPEPVSGSEVRRTDQFANVQKRVTFNRPFYANNMKSFVEQDGQTGDAFKNLTKYHPNIVLISGTILWKEINKADHTKEEIINTLPVFHGGKCIFLWDKRCTSDIDGVKLTGCGGWTRGKEPDEGRQLSKFQQDFLADTGGLVGSKFYRLHARPIKSGDLFASPYFEINLSCATKTRNIVTSATCCARPVPSDPLKIKVDICLDHIMAETAKGAITSTTGVKRALALNVVPDIYVVIAAGMSLDDSRIKSEDPKIAVLRCDQVYDANQLSPAAPWTHKAPYGSASSFLPEPPSMPGGIGTPVTVSSNWWSAGPLYTHAKVASSPTVWTVPKAVSKGYFDEYELKT